MGSRARHRHPPSRAPARVLVDLHGVAHRQRVEEAPQLLGLGRLAFPQDPGDLVVARASRATWPATMPCRKKQRDGTVVFL